MHHAHPIVVRGRSPIRLVGRVGGGNEENLRQIEAVRRRPRDLYMSIVNRIERASEQRDQKSAPLDFHRVDFDFFIRSVLRVAGHLRNLLDDVIAFHHFTENRMPVVEMRSRRHGDEELAAVGVRAGVRHRQDAGFRVLQRRMELIRELVARAAGARSLGASTLDHEVRNHAMEDDAVVEGLPRFFAFCKLDEVLYRLGHLCFKKLYFKAAFGRIEQRVSVICHICQFYRHGRDAAKRSAPRNFRKIGIESTHGSPLSGVAHDPCLVLPVGVFMTQAGGQQAQTTAEMTTKDAPISFSTAVDLVLVPVVVRDAQGHAVGNLTKDDFQLFDKGKPQVITKFAIDKAETPPILPDTSLETDAEGNPRLKPPGTAAAEPVASHFIAWLFDDVHLSFGDLAQTRVAAKRVLKESFAPGTRAAIYTTSGHTLLDFTEDRDKLDATLDEIKPWPTIPTGAVTDCPDISYFQADRIINWSDAQATAAAQADYLACFDSNQVKNQATAARAQGQQFDVAGAIATPIRMAALKVLEIGSQDTRNTLLALKALMQRMESMPGSRGIVMVSPGFYLLDDHRIDEMDVINSAIRHNVVISSLDARGLYALTTGETAENAPRHIDPLTNSIKSDYARQRALADEDILGELADATGGQFFHNRQ